MICIGCVPLPHKHILGSIIEIDEGHQVNLKTKQQLSTKIWPSYSKNKIAMRKTSITKQKNRKTEKPRFNFEGQGYSWFNYRIYKRNIHE
jgi:hypothetical protein